MEDKIIEILRSSNGLSFYESDFYDKLNLNDKIKYLNALNKEMELYKEEIKGKSIDSIFIGGGTPSCIDLTILETLLQQLYPLLDEDYEFSIECNIEDINDFCI